MRNYRSEYKNYHSKPEQKKRRAKRNLARRIMKKKLGSKINGKDIYPPVEKIFLISFFLSKKKDFTVKKKIKNTLKGKKKILFNLGVLILSTL